MASIRYDHFFKQYTFGIYAFLVFFFKMYSFEIYSFFTIFEKCIRFGLSFFQTNKVKVIRFSKNVYILEKRLKKTYAEQYGLLVHLQVHRILFP